MRWSTLGWSSVGLHCTGMGRANLGCAGMRCATLRCAAVHFSTNTALFCAALLLYDAMNRMYMLTLQILQITTNN